MKYVKMLGLLAVAASALMAFAATASADTVTSSTGHTPTIHATSEGHAILHSPVGTVECPSTITGTVTTHGPGKPVTGHISSLIFGTKATEGCTNGVVHVLKAGTLSVTATAEGNGTLTSSGAEISTTLFGVTCIYTTNSTHIGEVTDNPTGSPEHATLHIKSAEIPRTGGSAFCGSAGTWTGSYKVSHPTNLTVDKT